MGRIPDKLCARRHAETGKAGRHQKIGGHTLKKHVAKTDEELLARLAQRHDARAATSFYSVEQAGNVISAALQAHRFNILRWANTRSIEKPLEITWDADTEVGYGFRRGNQIKKNSSLVNLTQTYFGQDRESFGETIEEVVKRYCDNGENATRW